MLAALASSAEGAELATQFQSCNAKPEAQLRGASLLPLRHGRFGGQSARINRRNHGLGQAVSRNPGKKSRRRERAARVLRCYQNCICAYAQLQRRHSTNKQGPVASQTNPSVGTWRGPAIAVKGLVDANS